MRRATKGGAFKFPRSMRLKKTGEFRALIGSSKPRRTKHFVVHQAPNAELGPRLGISVSARVGCGVQRNRTKRLLREFFRLNRHRLGGSLDTVIIAKKGAPGLSCGDVSRELGFLLVENKQNKP